MRKGPFAKTKHPWGFWWLTLIVGIFVCVGISIGLGLGNGGANDSIITTIFCGTMLFFMPTTIKGTVNSNNKPNSSNKSVTNTSMKNINNEEIQPIEKHANKIDIDTMVDMTIARKNKGDSQND